MLQGQTEPPSALSEEELIDLMDKNGIGTDATMHEHIRTIQDRGYCSQDSARKFIPSALGIALVKGVGAYSGRLGGFHLAKPTLRALMERDMAQIAEGQLNRSQFISNYVLRMREIFQMITDDPRLLDGEINQMGSQPGGGSPPTRPRGPSTRRQPSRNPTTRVRRNPSRRPPRNNRR